MDNWLLENVAWVEELQASWDNQPLSRQREQLAKLENLSNSILDYWVGIEEQLHYFKEHLKNDDEVYNYRSTGTTYFELEMFEKAREHLQLEKETGVKDELRLLYLAYSYLYCDQFIQAKDQFLYLLQLTKDHVIKHHTLFGLACMACKKSKYDEAIFFFEQTKEWLPEDDDVVYNLGICHFLNHSFAHAVRYFYEAIKRNDHDGEAYYFLGCCLIELGERQAGFRALGQALHLLHSTESLLGLAYILEWNGKHEAALDCYKKLHTDGRETEACLHGFAWNYGMLNKRELSLNYFKKLFQLNPTHPTGADSFKWLASIWVCS
ncbi:hypothetical protein AJ85_11575 [Alkalihalobacillus alcalophilus ATCC 27647 = CGMCC 1.3604]|uniref:Tetratricopeptide repeat protein n=1 Tax=Alkalihalobacillus alcalophilus ATCC 27647 = CGMCC 1.3604 TaxID=1218173 RepID=A0A094XK08_ALKAL|nr:tetratricopeptide repeat protein [Alkalihalobacillus alcalophilus]KGA99110.1 hypothetical protein BALCAV_0200195 [Alkalihalobacillus alcalophilus ATCC 27647 = CGMCC 1.3604]MED1563466.1 CDC27 family protein [Alkalihalobacillus alcalophilus]THG90313.1 hypothetical protein AJ85_11575 [Alkalihalobacillus alcalophilus ATCC 27647 = CGMCC 1.3604]